jgi:hypothetical protein
MDKVSVRALITKIHNNLDRVLVAASGIALLVGGYFTLDYRSYTNCQAQILEATRNTNVVFADSLRILLSQPPRTQEERRHAFEDLQIALDHQREVQAQLQDCK